MLRPWDYDNDTLSALASSRVAEVLKHGVAEKYLSGKNGLFSLSLYAFSRRRLKKSLLVAELGVRINDRAFNNSFSRPISLDEVTFEQIADQAKRFLYLLPPVELNRNARPYQAGVVLASSLFSYGDHQRFVSRLIGIKPAGAIVSYRLMDMASQTIEDAERAAETYFLFVEAWGRLVQPKAREWLRSEASPFTDVTIANGI